MVRLPRIAFSGQEVNNAWRLGLIQVDFYRIHRIIQDIQDRAGYPGSRVAVWKSFFSHEMKDI